MKRNLLLAVLGLIVVLALAGCGEKSQEDIVKALDDKVENLTGYKAEAKMTLQAGAEPQEYDVEIWHKTPTFYRVNLKNPQKEQSQMILRNQEGVFVLTPALNKSFRFQSDWPQNSSQAYLYESLVKDILDDPEAKFTSTENGYVFETKTNYKNNKMLPVQEITFDKKDLTPVLVKVMDPDRNPLLTVEFSKFEFDPSFDENAFDVQKNMSGAQLEVPVMAGVSDEPLSVMYPEVELEGVNLEEEQKIETENGTRIVMTFGGEKSFTLIQERAQVSEVGTTTVVSGEPVDLGFTVGALTENSLSWSYQGVDFMLASEDLTQEEMQMIARSVQGQSIK